MSVCTFFGHRDCPASVKPKLKAVLVDLIENHAVDTFYIGNQGAFDSHARLALQELVQAYPHIRYTVVLAYLPKENETYSYDTLFPDGIEAVPKRFAIGWRNKWMLKRADYVVAYITHSWGGAGQFAERAQKEGKKVIHLAEK